MNLLSNKDKSNRILLSQKRAIILAIWKTRSIKRQIYGKTNVILVHLLVLLDIQLAIHKVHIILRQEHHSALIVADCNLTLLLLDLSPRTARKVVTPRIHPGQSRPFLQRHIHHFHSPFHESLQYFECGSVVSLPGASLYRFSISRRNALDE